MFGFLLGIFCFHHHDNSLHSSTKWDVPHGRCGDLFCCHSHQHPLWPPIIQMTKIAFSLYPQQVLETIIWSNRKLIHWCYSMNSILKILSVRTITVQTVVSACDPMWFTVTSTPRCLSLMGWPFSGKDLAVGLCSGVVAVTQDLSLLSLRMVRTLWLRGCGYAMSHSCGG